MADGLYYIPLWRGYRPGEHLCVELFSPAGAHLGLAQLDIIFRAGRDEVQPVLASPV